MTTLGPLFRRDLHVASWGRPLNGPSAADFRVTNTFDGPDLINGGKHDAIDVGNKTRLPPALGGNTGAGEPILCPMDCMVRPLYHWDGALGLDLSLTETLTLRLWHLSKTAVPVARPTGKFVAMGQWEPTLAGRIIGVTGNSGKQPMPAHTHIELWQSGQRIDPAPYLDMVEAPALPLPEDDVKLRSGQALTVGDVGKGNRLRTDPNTSAGSVITPDTIQVKVLQTDTTGEPYTLSGSTNNRYTTVGLESGEVYYVAAPLVTNIRLKGAGLQIPQITQGDVDRARYEGRKTMREEAINAATGLSV
ncbi:MAG: hypothetical protein IT341_10795 [Chloroflexi bacterium]|nr:hypothetical protein [Chloroflexota bacterium]